MTRITLRCKEAQFREYMGSVRYYGASNETTKLNHTSSGVVVGIWRLLISVGECHKNVQKNRLDYYT